MKPDIILDHHGDSYFITPASAAGLVWLQCHFEEDEWDYLSMGATCLDRTSASELTIDAEDGGLLVHLVETPKTFIPGFHD